MKPTLPSKTGTPAESPAEAPRETDLAPLLTAWDRAHPTIADPEWRHVLDEIAHPRTTEAFRHLAGAGGGRESGA